MAMALQMPPLRKTQAKPNNRATERFIAQARAVGCPPDQVRNFLRAGYVPQPKQLRFHATARECDAQGGPDQVGLGGARGPGKSHAALAQLALDDCQRVAGLKGLFLRRVGKQARESFEDLRLRVLRNVPHDYNSSRGIVTFPNGSRIFLGHFQHEKDVDQYLGLEYDVVVIEECTSLSKSKYQAVRDSNRTSKPNWRPRIYNTTNPGGVGHAWYRRQFIEPARKGVEAFTRFIFATVDDNVFIDHGYRRKLEENTGWRLQAYRYGSWDIAAGQFFTTFSYPYHIITPIEVQPHWDVWCAMDYGFVHPTVIHLFAQDGDGNIYTVVEHWAQRTQIPQHATAIKQMLEMHNVSIDRLRVFVAGADVFAKRDDGGSVAEKYKRQGISLTAANMDRVNGWAEMLDKLGDPERGIEPRWFIVNTCHYLIETLPILEHNPRRPEDVLKVDVDDDGIGGDDAGDCARYGLMAAHKRVMRSGSVDWYAPSAQGTAVKPARSEAEIERMLNNYG